MILHPLLGAASESGDATFFEDYGTLLASFVALAGALATLLVSGRRAARDSRITREDAYRDDTRRKVADLLAAATLYERHGRVASDPSRWLDAGQDKAAEFAGYSEQALSRLEAALVLAQLTPVFHDDSDGLIIGRA